MMLAMRRTLALTALLVVAVAGCGSSTPAAGPTATITPTSQVITPTATPTAPPAPAGPPTADQLAQVDLLVRDVREHMPKHGANWKVGNGITAGDDINSIEKQLRGTSQEAASLMLKPAWDEAIRERPAADKTDILFIALGDVGSTG